jgi:catechol 2,3-dioxygenase-like lactoylglutathione lyase family enzyme
MRRDGPSGREGGSPVAKKRRTQALRGVALEFNHAMIYTKKLARSLAFYRDLLGFRVIDEYPGAYARLVSPKGKTTIALHVLEPGQKLAAKRAGVRLYFETRALDRCCQSLKEHGVRFDQMPQDMPWGWRHAYLRDPDGHELSLYRAGAARLRKTRIV